MFYDLIVYDEMKWFCLAIELCLWLVSIQRRNSDTKYSDTNWQATSAKYNFSQIVLPIKINFANYLICIIQSLEFLQQMQQQGKKYWCPIEIILKGNYQTDFCVLSLRQKTEDILLRIYLSTAPAVGNFLTFFCQKKISDIRRQRRRANWSRTDLE